MTRAPPPSQNVGYLCQNALCSETQHQAANARSTNNAMNTDAQQRSANQQKNGIVILLFLHRRA